MRYIPYRFLILFFVLALSAKAWADIVNDFVQVQCLEDLNMLKIDSFGANGEIARDRSSENQNDLWERHGIRNMRTMVDYIRLIDENGKPSEDHRDTRMVPKDPIQTSCTLVEEMADGKREPRTYEIHIKPYFFNTNPMGRCGGGSPTTELTITAGDRVLIDRLRFLSECSSYEPDHHNRGMAMGGISSIYIYPESQYLTVDGGLYEEYEDEFIFPYLIWFDEGLPVTHETVYGKRKKSE